LDALKRPDAVFGKTPIPFNRSNRLISFVASNPFMTGSWISMRTKWNPPCRHFRTASSPFAAHFQRTFNRFMKASKSFWLMILSSTMSTLIGGTVPSIKPPKPAAGDVAAFDFRVDLGEDTAGGVWVLTLACGDSTACGAGGVGTAGMEAAGIGWEWGVDSMICQ
jgi:hypothetical protein